MNDLDVATLPLTLTLLPARERDMVSLLERPLAGLWPDLTPAAVETSLHALLRLKVCVMISSSQTLLLLQLARIL